MGGWTYMLRCSDDSYYVGSTSYNDMHLRIVEHNDGRYAGYTFYRRPLTLVWSQWFDDLREAHAKERQLKGWGRAKKLALINGSGDALVRLAKRRAAKSKSGPKSSIGQVAEQFHSAGLRHPEVAAKAAHEG